MFELKTKRLLLRDFREEDLIAYQQVGNRTEALRYYSQSPTEWGAHVEGLVKKFLESQITYQTQESRRWLGEMTQMLEERPKKDRHKDESR